MITVKLGNLNVRASIEHRVWSSDHAPTRRLLQADTDDLFVHGGIPDVDEFVVAELAKRWPIEVIERRPLDEDPEATDSAAAGGDAPLIY